jgi:glucose/arabinose dehydrogenase
MNRKLTLSVMAAVFMHIWLSATAQPQLPPAEPEVPPMVGHIFQPELVEFEESLLENLQLPPGFEIQVFAQDLGNPRKLAIAEDGTVYATRRESGDVIRLRDTDGDWRADEIEVVAEGIDHINGVIIHEGRIYLGPPTQVLVADLNDDGSLGELEVFMADLPDGGQHPNRTFAMGPDGMFYISIGSSCNACDESNEEHATMLRAEADGTNRSIYAEGLRNTVGFSWHPETGELWGLDMGTDWRGDDSPPEELNHIEQGHHYGWPFCWGDRQVDPYLPDEPEGMTKEEFCPTTAPPRLTYQAHASPLDMLFYNGEQFPEDYRGDALVTLRGSWNRFPAVGYKLVRIRFENGEPVAFEDFITGFLINEGREQFGRPVGIVMGNDGAIFFADDTNGVIYRVSYNGAD